VSAGVFRRDAAPSIGFGTGRHVVQAEQDGWSIANERGVSLADLQAANIGLALTLTTPYTSPSMPEQVFSGPPVRCAVNCSTVVFSFTSDQAHTSNVWCMLGMCWQHRYTVCLHAVQAYCVGARQGVW
jgi:hypothetical protein